MEIDRALTYREEILRAYDCPHCGQIHLTAMTEEKYERTRHHGEGTGVYDS